ncbi:mycofactocin biosynthesis peptidyl-dipeptidase MftE [Pseudonocardia ailaonensis]|uniref:Mycofactocin biosynthesis peptidyl-dipeptidase MftE n=1 Tax=Pseudonocardia ailaonensis TaxID=367279 RepID=A0ABN2NI63_9PSEU
MTWPDLRDDPPRTVMIPLGSVEQHGPHLPLSTDLRVAEHVASGLESRRPELVLAPGLPYGAAGEHEGFPGTVSIGQEALRLVLVEAGRSACRWAARLVFVNGHGGNVGALVEAVRLLRYEGRDVAWLPCAAPGVRGDAHAGRIETSLLLDLDPAAVQVDRAEAGATAPLRELLPVMREGGVEAVSPNGVLGDPAGASAEEGAALFAAIVDAGVRAIDGWAPDAETGRLAWS